MAMTCQYCAVQLRMTQMNDELTELLGQAERLGEEGDVDGAQAAAAHAEALKVYPECLPQPVKGFHLL